MSKEVFYGFTTSFFKPKDVISYNEDERMFIPIFILKNDDGEFQPQSKKVTITVEMED